MNGDDGMTEKRFDYTHYDDGTESIYDRKEDEYYWDIQLSEIEEVMNDLAEENERLIQSKADWETSFDICKTEKDELLEENKRLKLELETFKAGNQTLKATLDEVKNG